MPEVCEQVTQVVGRVMDAMPRWELNDLNLDGYSLFLVGMCSGVLEITGLNPDTGNYNVKLKDQS